MFNIINLPEDATGDVTVYVAGNDGGTFRVPIVDGMVSVTAGPWTVTGKFSVVAVYEGDIKYYRATSYASFTVS